MSEDIHSEFMKLALSLARRAKNKQLPNPMVGAVLVKEGRVVGKGYHRKAGEPHAEVFAIQHAGGNVAGSTLYVTLEPCSHYGRTPPCTDLIIRSGIKKVVVSMIDPNPVVRGKGIRRLRDAGIDVTAGIMQDEAKEMNKVYIKNITRRMPYVIFKEAMTLDGRTATISGDSRWISSDSSRRYVHKLRSSVEGIMVGAGTVLKDNPSLTTHGVGEEQPYRIVVDSSLEIPLTARILNDRFRSKTLIVTTDNAPEKKIKVITKKGAGVIMVKRKGNLVDLNDLMKKLYELNIYRVLVEGGATLGGSLFKENLIDEIIIFVAPKLIGNGKGVLEGYGVSRIRYARHLKDVIIKRIDGDIMIEGKL